jgi:bifunctional UDP-N-acetylglucosamine pyrophosphorylase/glucosamine-1-phosphate N-acetyltransferase
MQKQIVILAAGKGSRMKSDIPKPMQLVKSKPMLDTIISASKISTSDIILVHSDSLNPYLNRHSDCKLVSQKEQLGTAHAVSCALSKIKKDSFVTIIYADHPFIDNIVIDKVFDSIIQSNYACVTLASIQTGDNTYGRIINNGLEINKIVEFKNLLEDEKKISLCNSAVMSFAPGVLHKFLPMVLEMNLEERKSTEYYLTAIVEILVQNDQKVSYVIDQDYKYSVGVNTQTELQTANQSTF